MMTPGVLAHAAENDHHHDLDGFDEIETAGREELFEVRVNAAGQSGEERADDERR